MITGCAHDVLKMSAYLASLDHHYETRILLDQVGYDSCTRKNIIASIRWLTAGARVGDKLLLLFSGHGGTLAHHQMIFPGDFQRSGVIFDEVGLEELAVLMATPNDVGVE